MNISHRFSASAVRLLAASAVASSVLAMALPGLAHAATYAYVNQSQQVSTITADSWMSALLEAPDIDIHSGVLLLSN